MAPAVTACDPIGLQFQGLHLPNEGPISLYGSKAPGKP